MATDHALKSVTNTLTGTTADRITLDQLWPAIEITNQDTTNYAYIVMDGSATPTAVAEADNATAIPPGVTKVMRAIPSATLFTTIVLSIVGSGGKYTIEGVN